MSLWAIIPVKPFAASKSRLAHVLSQKERAALSRQFFEHTLHVLGHVPEVAQTLVVSRDASVLALAREHKAHTVAESSAPNLNAALHRATEVALKLGARAVLVLPADLPLLTEQEVRQLIEPEGSEPVVVIAPDRHRQGTNALFLRPPGVIAYAFGENSYAQHRARVEQVGARLRLCRLPGVALDVDTPDDLDAYRKISLHQPHVVPPR